MILALQPQEISDEPEQLESGRPEGQLTMDQFRA